MSDHHGFVPPPYPYDQLADVAARAAAFPGGAIDLSVGTPCDPTPPAVLETLADPVAARGYPSSVGSMAFRQAASGWMARRLGVDVSPDDVAACVGTKELVASTAWFLRLRDPDRDTVLHPAIAYPTYAMGAALAGCRAVAVPESATGGPDLDAVDAVDASRAVVLWLNSPSNPTGVVSDLEAAADWGRRHGVPVVSDECYTEFTWSRWPPSTILAGDTAGVLALHSLSKRSNAAGLRAGFYAGDRELVRYLSEVRKHAGLMVPGPVQGAAAQALDDDAHVEVQRRRYRRRLERLADALCRSGLDVGLPEGGFYLWVAAPGWARPTPDDGRSAGWVLAEALADAAGMLVSPGDFYGEAGADHVRIAVVQSDELIDLAVERLDAGTLPAARADRSDGATRR